MLRVVGSQTCIFLAAACSTVLEPDEHLEGLLDDAPRRALAEVAEKADATISDHQRAPAARDMKTQTTET